MLSTSKFEPMLLEAYGEGADKEKWTFANKRGVMIVTRAGQTVPAVPFRPVASPTVKTSVKKRKALTGQEGKTALGGDKKESHLKGQLSKMKRLFEDELFEGGSSPKRTKLSDKSEAERRSKPKGKEPEAKRADAKPVKAKEKAKVPVPSIVTEYALEDSEDRMHPPDRLNLVGENEEGKPKSLSLYYVAEDGTATGKHVIRWKVTADPLGIAVQTKNANEW